MSTRSAVLAALVLAMVAPAATADVEASVDLGIGHSDNVARLPSNEVSDTLGSLALHFRGAREEGRLTGSLQSDLEYITYFDNTLDDDLFGRIDLRGRYEFVPGNFAWVLDDSWGQLRATPFFAPSPLNVDNVNWLSTGPDITLRFGARSSLKLTGRYGSTTYGDLPGDYDTLTGGLTISREVSERSTVSLSGSASRIEFDNPGFGSDYDRQEGYLRFDTKGARTTLSVDVGYSAIHDRLDTSDSPLFRVVLTRETGAQSKLTLRAGQEFSDDGLAFSGFSGPRGGFGSSSNIFGSGDPFENRYFGVDWNIGRDRTRLALGATWRQEEYETASSLDRDVFSLHASLRRQLSSALTLNLSGHWEQEDMDSGLIDDDRVRLGAGLTWDAQSRVYVSVDVEHYSGSSNAAFRDYDETRAWLRVGYRAR